jgi:predicted nuclease of predicted toxin-antitoxin system
VKGGVAAFWLIYFLVDLNVGQTVAAALRQAGHDVFFVGDYHDPRISDIDILRLAVQEQRIVINLDADFGELVYHSGESHYGVLLLRMPDARAVEKANVVEEIITRFGDQLPQHFCVYRNGRLRIR